MNLKEPGFRALVSFSGSLVSSSGLLCGLQEMQHGKAIVIDTAARIVMNNLLIIVYVYKTGV